MTGDAGEVAVLARAHALFGPGSPGPGYAGAVDALGPGLASSDGDLARAYRRDASWHRDEVVAARRVDDRLLGILAAASADHDTGRRNTAAVLAAARADSGVPAHPLLARELLRRRVARLRAQHGHVLAARRRARRRRAALAALRYRLRGRQGRGRQGRVERAVRAALSRLGSPYVWGATGPNRFDCSGLVQWAYAQAGVPLARTTYDQIGQGLPVAHSDVRPGDLVFPHTGHVQMAIGGGLVVEAPHAGASVRISELGSAVAIRRPV